MDIGIIILIVYILFVIILRMWTPKWLSNLSTGASYAIKR